MRRKLIQLALLSASLLAVSVVYGSDSDAIPAGTKLDIRLMTDLTTKTNRRGDPFKGEIEHPVFSGNAEIIPGGSAVYGHIDELQRAGRQGTRMHLVVDTITAPFGMVYNLSPEVQRLTSMRDAEHKPAGETTGGGGGGAKQAKQEPRIQKGTDLPPGAVAVVMDVRHKDIILKPGTELTFLLKQAVAATKAAITK